MTTDAAGTGQLRRVLGLPALVLFGLAYMVPLTVFTTFGVVTVDTEGHLAGAYVITLAAMLFTAYSYGRMVTVHPFAGSAYTYAQKSFGAGTGFVVGWALLLDYVFLPMINYLLIGIYLEAEFPAVPAEAWVVGAIAVVTTLNIIGVEFVTRANLLLVGVQVVFVAVFLVLALQHLSGTDVASPLDSFASSDTSLSLVLGGSAILCLSFLGFDAISTMSEETADPRRTIPRAILLATVIGGVTYIVLSWVSAMVFPDWQSFTDVDSAALDVMGELGAGFMTSFFTAAYIAGCFGSAMASQASVSRILYAMGRDGVLPRGFFGQVSRRFGTPVPPILLVGVVSLVALFISLTLASAVISFGALAAFTFVNLAVTKHFLIDEGLRGAGAVLRYGVLPGIGTLLCAWLWTSLSRTTFEVGLVWVAIGLVYLAVLTRGFRQPAPELGFDEAASAPDETAGRR